MECHCDEEFITTYGSIYHNAEDKSYGGYANYNCANSSFVFLISKGLDSSPSGLVLCAGITMFSL